MRVADEVLGTVGLPADGFAKPLGGDEEERIFAIEKDAGAETSAHVAGRHAQSLAGNLEDLIGQRVAEAMNALAADGEGQPAVRGVYGRNRAARLHVVRDDAGIDDGDRYDAGGFGEGLVGFRLVAHMGVKGDVSRRAGKDLRGVRAKRGERVSDRGKRLPIDGETLRAVSSCGLRSRNDHGDDIADVVRLLFGHDGIGL